MLLFTTRDLFDLSKDNIQIKESKAQGILLHGVTEVCLSFIGICIPNLFMLNRNNNF